MEKIKFCVKLFIFSAGFIRFPTFGLVGDDLESSALKFLKYVEKYLSKPFFKVFMDYPDG